MAVIPRGEVTGDMRIILNDGPDPDRFPDVFEARVEIVFSPVEKIWGEDVYVFIDTVDLEVEGDFTIDLVAVEYDVIVNPYGLTARIEVPENGTIDISEVLR